MSGLRRPRHLAQKTPSWTCDVLEACTRRRKICAFHGTGIDTAEVRMKDARKSRNFRWKDGFCLQIFGGGAQFEPMRRLKLCVGVLDTPAPMSFSKLANHMQFGLADECRSHQAFCVQLKCIICEEDDQYHPLDAELTPIELCLSLNSLNHICAIEIDTSQQYDPFSYQATRPAVTC